MRAPIILATLETYRNSLLGIEPDMRRKVVVYDEYHYLQDDSRGSAWEESLILTPPGSQLILLSASVPNSEDFAQWMTQLTGVESKVIRVTKRPVPLEHVIYCKNYGWILSELLNLSKQDIQQISILANRVYKSQPHFRTKEYYMEHVPGINEALELNLGPLVVYAGRRGDVEGFAQTFARFIKVPMNPEFKSKLEERLKNLSGWEYVPQELKRLISKFGIAYHHSGMIPPGRVAIESLLKEGLLRVCCGTMGISLGVNFAVRSAYVTDTHRPSEGGDTSYSNTEIMQMLGRAGRRGRDAQGFSLWFNAGRFVKQSPKAREVCRSSLKIDPTTILSILGVHKNLDYLHEFYEKSFYMRSLGNGAAVEDHTSIDYIVGHLQKIGALEGYSPTTMGNISRYFPQAGGLIVAQWLAEGTINHETFFDYLQTMACFGAAHFKEIPTTHADMEFLEKLNMNSLIDAYYPYNLFPELYDEIKNRRFPNAGGEIVFREFNFGAASIIKHWLNPKTTWEQLVADHSSKYFETTL